MKIGDRIKVRRMELGWSQRELADRMECNHSTITRIETGKIDISQSKIMQFSKILGVSIAYLMGWEEKTENSSPPDKLKLTEGEEKLLELFRLIPEEQQQMVLDMIRVALNMKE